MCIFDQVKLLHENGMHSNTVTLGSFVLSICKNSADSSMGPSVRYQTMVFMGKALQAMMEFRRAEAMYKKALQFLKSITKNKLIKTSELCKDGASEIDVKYAMAECHISVREISQAVAVFESIPQRHRTPKINMALGQLYQQAGRKPQAIMAYKEVIKECPLALDAVKELLNLGVLGAEIASNMLNFTSVSRASTEWLSIFVKGHAYLYSSEYNNAVSTFKHLEENTVLRKNTIILETLGQAYYLEGDTKNAMSILQRVHTLDPLNVQSVDLLASLYAQEKRTKELESLAMVATAVTDTAPQPWIAMGYYCQLTKKITKAIYFAHKACSLNPRSVEGLLLKGSILLDIKKLQEALMHFREAQQTAPHRFEPHKGVVDCYLAMHKQADAIPVAINACEQLRHTPRALTLYASVLLKEPDTVAKGLDLLTKALKEDPYYLPAVFLYCDVSVQSGDYESAIDVLRTQVSVQPSCKLHQLLAEYHTHIQDKEKAAHHSNVALNLSHDISNPLCMDGGGKGEAMGVGEGLMEVEDIAASEGEIEESDLEAVWPEYSLGGQ